MDFLSRKAELSTQWADLSDPDAASVAAEIAKYLISELPRHLPAGCALLRNDITAEMVLRALTNTCPFWNGAQQPESLYIPINKLVCYYKRTNTLLVGYIDVFDIPSSIHAVSLGDAILVNGYGEGILSKLTLDVEIDEVVYKVQGLGEFDDLTRIVGKK